MAEQFLLSFALIAVAIVGGGIAAVRFKFPPVVILIVLGIILGPHVIGIVEDGESIRLFSEIGGILLLFLIGTEFSFNKIMKLGLNSVIVAVIELVLLFILVYSIAIVLGFSPLTSMFIALAISVTSTALTVKMLQDLGLSNRQETALLIGVSVIEDVVAVFVLGILSSLASGVEVTPETVTISIVKSMFILILAYITISKTIGHVLKTHEINEDNMLMLALGLAMGLSFLATYLGLSPAIGAFVAGNIISSLPQAKEFNKSIHKFGLLFISIFFLSIGVLVNPSNIVTEFSLIVLLLGLAVIGKFIGVGIGTYFAGYSGESAVFAGVAMMPIGEISLLIIKTGVDLGAVPSSFLGATAVLVLVTALISYPAIVYNRRLYGVLDQLVPMRLKSIGRTISSRMSHYRYQLSVDGSLFKEITSGRGALKLLIGLPMLLLSVFYLMPTYLGKKATLLIFLAFVAVVLTFLYIRGRKNAPHHFSWKRSPPRKIKYRYNSA